MAARCETVLNTTMAEMETYHTQKGEDFRTLTKEHLDGEIAFYQQVSTVPSYRFRVMVMADTPLIRSSTDFARPEKRSILRPLISSELPRASHRYTNAN